MARLSSFLVPVAFVCLVGPLSLGCSSLTSPPEGDRPSQAPPTQTAVLPKPAPTVVPMAPPPGGLPSEERIGASHLLVAYKGARGADAKIARTKEQAKKRAEEALKKARGGDDFASLAKQYSDDPGSGPRGGDLGSFNRKMMVPEFSSAAFALKVGETSGVVESDFGFHVIKRTQ